MERFLLWVIFIGSGIVAFSFLHSAQGPDLTLEQVRNIAVFGYLFTAMTGVSGIGIALGLRS